MLKTTNNTVYVVISLFYQRFCGFHRAAERSLKKKSDSQNLFKKENIFFSQTCMHILVSFLCSPARDGSFSSPPARYIRSTVFHTLVFRNSLLLFSACVALCAFFFWTQESFERGACPERCVPCEFAAFFDVVRGFITANPVIALIFFRMIYSMTSSALQYLNTALQCLNK